MIRDIHNKNDHRKIPIWLSVLMLSLLVIAAAFGDFSYADEAQSKTDTPMRSAHKVKVADKDYCFFVTHNVKLTVEEIQKCLEEGRSDEGVDDLEPLETLIFERAGLYMKETNCTKEEHAAITVEDWRKTKGNIVLGEEDLAQIIGAQPVEGAPVKLYMDVDVTVNKDEAFYSTYKLLSPSLLFISIVADEDADKTEDICEAEEKPEPSQPAQTPVTPVKPPAVKKLPKVAAPKEDLPEFKTIKMVNRAGAPIEETLKDGEPVTLTWREPGMHADDDKKGSLISRIPGGILGLVLIAAVLAGIIAVLYRMQQKRTERISGR